MEKLVKCSLINLVRVTLGDPKLSPGLFSRLTTSMELPCCKRETMKFYRIYCDILLEKRMNNPLQKKNHM